MPDREMDDAASAPLLTLNCIPVDYYDSIDALGVRGDTLRLLMWRWTKVAGVWVREPVREIIRPVNATARIRASIEAAERPPWRGMEMH